MISSKKQLALEYQKNIKELNFQQVSNYVNNHSYMMFFAFAENSAMRDKYLHTLRTNGIDARLSWLPLNNQPVNDAFHKSVFPNSENIYSNSLTLPIYNSMTDDELKFVIETCQNV